MAMENLYLVEENATVHSYFEEQEKVTRCLKERGSSAEEHIWGAGHGTHKEEKTGGVGPALPASSHWLPLQLAATQQIGPGHPNTELLEEGSNHPFVKLFPVTAATTL